MSKERISFLLKKYTTNSINREDYDELMGYISRSGNDEELYELMEKEWDNLNEEGSFHDLDHANLYHKITSDPRFSLSTEPSEKSVFYFRRWMSVAAGIFMVFGVVAFLLHRTKQMSQQQAVVYYEKTVPYGKKIQIGLSDGTQVWVNSGSKLRYPSSFTGSKRELYLEGEAYFDVAHDEKRPFIIHTGKVFTQVLGTAFNIKAYGSSKMSVTVARGKVSVGLQRKLLSILTPNQCLSYNQISGDAKKYKVNASRLRWMNGDLILDDTNLGEAAQVIERWYNVKITFNNPDVKTYHFTASFLKHENIDQVMNVLSELTRFRYERNGSEIIIK
ncbi:MAG: FecR domain-containing protein [Mucilaginibacter sp.]|uniref:FecR family protein n=1 Tax=Mucilaginibacter sp. TaxID=1882438 RepID=UPI0031A334FE